MHNETGKNSIVLLAADTVSSTELKAGADQNWVGVRYRKMLAKYGEWLDPYNPQSKMVLDKAWAEEIVKNFADKSIIPHVPIPKDHEDYNVDKNTGEVIELSAEDDGLYGVLEIRRWGASSDIEDGLIFDVSIGFSWDYVTTIDGKHHGVVLEHVALTNIPYLEQLGDFQRTDEQIAKDEAEAAMWDEWFGEFSRSHSGSAIMLDKKKAKELSMHKNKKQQLSKVKNDRDFDITITVKDEDDEAVEHVVKAGEEVDVPEAQVAEVTQQIADAEKPTDEEDEHKDETPEEKAAREAKEAEDAAAAEEAEKAEKLSKKNKDSKTQLSKDERAELDRLRASESTSKAEAAYATLLSKGQIIPAMKEAFIELHKTSQTQKVNLSRDGKSVELDATEALVGLFTTGRTMFSQEQDGTKKGEGTDEKKKPSENLSDDDRKGLEAHGVSAARMDALAEKSPLFAEQIAKIDNKDN